MRKILRYLLSALALVLVVTAMWWTRLPLFTRISTPPGIVFADKLFRGARRYNHPELFVENGKWYIQGQNSSSGVYFDFYTDPKTKYKLIIRGRSVDGEPLLRLRQEKRGKVYLHLPDGERQYIINGVDQFELRFYSDKSFAYALEKIHLAPCREWKTNTDLKHLILREKPMLHSLLEKDRTAAARVLLDWAASNTDWDNSSRFVAEATGYANQFEASQIYFQMFASDNGAVYCDGAAVFFDKILKIFGYNSFIIDFGDIRDGLTHVTTIIPLKRDGEWDYYIFDPTFNATFTSHAGNLLSLFQIIDWLRNERQDDIVIRSRSLAARDFVIKLDSISKCPILKRKVNGFALCGYPNYGFETYLRNFHAAFVKNGYPSGKEGFFQLLQTRIFRVGNSGDPFYRKDFLSKIKVVGIPIE